MDKDTDKKITNTVYLFNTEILYDRSLVNAALAVLPFERRKEIEKISSTVSFSHSLAGGVLLSLGLFEIGIDAAELEYSREQHGKPFLPSLPEFHFSISHSGKRAVCTISDKEVGADIEELRSDRRNFQKLSERYFSKDEAEYICSLASDKQSEEFLRIWCLKESAVKLSGKGIADIRRYECFDTQERKAKKYICFENEEYGYFTEFSFEGYRAAVCSLSDAQFCLRNVTSTEIEKFLTSRK